MLDFRRNHQIRKLQINLLDLKLHFIVCNLHICRMFLDQLMNRLFLTNYETLGPEIVFKIWWLSFYLESTGKNNNQILAKYIIVLKYQGLRMFVNMKIHYDAMRRLPEFSGLRGKVFPGQEPPPQPVIIPRRPDLPLGFSNDWKNIGSRRPRHTVTILVTPAE